MFNSAADSPRRMSNKYTQFHVVSSWCQIWKLISNICKFAPIRNNSHVMCHSVRKIKRLNSKNIVSLRKICVENLTCCSNFWKWSSKVLDKSLYFDTLRSVHTKRLHNQCYIDGQNGYAAHSANHGVRQKDQKVPPSNVTVTVTGSFDVNRPSLRECVETLWIKRDIH